jgi:multicomponent Na+:H+ antiporter subunit C
MVEANHELYLLAGAALFALGFYGVLARRRLLAKLVALNVMGSGVFLVFIAFAAGAAVTPGATPDPVPHAMVLTGIVVSVCATGLGLALADRVERGGGSP